MKQLLFSFALLLFADSLQAQDFTFSQYATMPYLINPAAVGQVPTFTPVGQNRPTTYQHRLASIFRSQWDSPGAANGLWGSAAGWDMSFCNGQSSTYVWGMGLFVQQDQANPGRFTNLNLRGMASFSHQLWGQSWMSYGVSGGALQYSIRPNELTFNRQFNGTTGQFDLGSMFSGEDGFAMKERESSAVGDMDLGLRVHNKASGWYAGATLHHVLQPRYSFVRGNRGDVNTLGIGFSLQGAVPIPGTSLVVSGLLRKQSFSENRQWQAVAGLSHRFRFASCGAMLRVSSREKGSVNATGDALTPFGSINFSRWTLRGSWDLNISRLKARAGGMELSFGLFLIENRDCHRCPDAHSNR